MSRNSRRAVALAIAGAFAISPMVSACAAGEHPQSALPTQLTEGVNASVHQVDVRNLFVLGPEPGQRLTAGSSAPVYAWFVNHASSPDRLVGVEAPDVAQSAQIAGGAIDLPPYQLVSTTGPAAGSPAPSTSGASTGAPTPSAAAHGTRTPGRKPASGPGAGTPKPSTLPSGAPPPGAPTGGTPTPGAPASGAPTPGASTGGQGTSRVILTGLARDFMGGETVKLTLRFQQAGAVTLDVPVQPRVGYFATFAPATPATPTTPAPTTPTTPPGTAKARATTTGNSPGAAKPKKASPTPAA